MTPMSEWMASTDQEERIEVRCPCCREYVDARHIVWHLNSRNCPDYHEQKEVLHVPDFGAPSNTDRAQGITAKCRTCRKLLHHGVEFIMSGCIGGQK